MLLHKPYPGQIVETDGLFKHALGLCVTSHHFDDLVRVLTELVNGPGLKKKGHKTAVQLQGILKKSVVQLWGILKKTAV